LNAIFVVDTIFTRRTILVTSSTTFFTSVHRPTMKQKKKNTTPPTTVDTRQLITDSDVMVYALQLIGLSTKKIQRASIVKNTRRLRAHFGCDQKTLVSIFTDLPREIKYKDVFIALHWLKQYPTREVMSTKFHMCEEYVSCIAQECTKALQKLKKKKICFNGFHSSETWLLSVDGVHFPINEVRTDPSAKWYSHKFHGPGLAYEFGVALRRDALVWMRGPFYASIHDINIFRGGKANEKKHWDKKSLYHKLPKGTKAIGDSGYAGEPTKITIAKQQHTEEFREFISRAKCRQEAFHSRLKFFNVLTHRFRHGVEKHQMCVEAVAVVVQYNMENGHPLMDL
jgi:hypothetical protein